MPRGRIPLADVTVSRCTADGGGSRSMRECSVSVEGKGKSSAGGVVPMGVGQDCNDCEECRFVP